jgi:hypothetical protein
VVLAGAAAVQVAEGCWEGQEGGGKEDEVRGAAETAARYCLTCPCGCGAQILKRTLISDFV